MSCIESKHCDGHSVEAFEYYGLTGTILDGVIVIEFSQYCPHQLKVRINIPELENQPYASSA
jgi:hypothetical protein